MMARGSSGKVGRGGFSDKKKKGGGGKKVWPVFFLSGLAEKLAEWSVAVAKCLTSRT
jgi:hypothetical protein